MIGYFEESTSSNVLQSASKLGIPGEAFNKSKTASMALNRSRRSRRYNMFHSVSPRSASNERAIKTASCVVTRRAALAQIGAAEHEVG